MAKIRNRAARLLDTGFQELITPDLIKVAYILGVVAYAVFVDLADKVWVSDFAGNAIVRFDPETEKFESFPGDRENANVRQMLGRPGELWGAKSGTDRLGVIRHDNAATGE